MDEPVHDAAKDEKSGDLRLGPRRHGAHDGKDRPLHAVPRERQRCELPRGPDDDPDHGGANAIEGRQHPDQPSVSHIEPADADRHHERGEDEGEGDEGGAPHSRVDVPEADCKLGGEGPGGELGEREGLQILLPREPGPALDQVTLHVAHQRHGPPEPQTAQVEEVPEEGRRRWSLQRLFQYA